MSKSDIAGSGTISFVSSVLLTLLLSAWSGAFIYFFSGIGVGLEGASNETSNHASELFKVVGVSLAAGYLFDFEFAKTPILSGLFAVTILLLTAVAMIMSGGAWPLCVYTITVPVLMLGVKFLFFRHIPTLAYVRSKYVIFILVGSLTLALFIAWVVSSVVDPTDHGNMWDADTRVMYSDKLGCHPVYDGLTECMNVENGLPCFFNENKTAVQFSGECHTRCIEVYENCTNAFILWISPGFAALSLIVLGLIAKFIKPPKDFFNHHVMGVMNFVAFFLFIFWIYASFAGAGNGFTGDLVAFGMSMVFGVGVIMTAVLWKDIANNESEQLIEDVMEHHKAHLDLIKGFSVLALSPLIILFLAVSILHQIVRKITYPCRGRSLEHKGYLSQEASEFVEDFKSWNHSQVLTYSVYCGIGYIGFAVLASKFTTLFLSWLIGYTSTMDIFAVTGIVVGVGMMMFMLPPVPGLPIYLTSGIVLVSVGTESFGIYGAITYACFVSWALKLFACAVQQCVIGGLLGGSISVKQAVAINSDAVRAMRLVLSEPGITSGKVAILVGGPDWPVSVLCGILGLKLLPILVGTLPVIAIIAPTVLSGSFSYMSSIETDNDGLKYPWAGTVGTVVTTATAAVMFVFTISAAGTITTTLETRKDELDQLEYDKEVKDANEKAGRIAAVRNRVQVW
eukprot:CAMPEP_0194358230 /NCGR_PEP_ID=MMETSP0174-20130528/5511_1 /TAXON_ID=216777 /ORGANISM="Proboscia alata, Strain PI-D3" /LENGTH=679 /DNA_ID=CAMNT_0039128489 /DNA_START=37 /DNA_END=2073 /DNA_ORIENTATION=+